MIAVLLHGATLSHEDGDWDTSERYLTRILEMDACHEQAACALMVVLKAQGRIPDGLRAYGQLEIALEQLGVEPSLETQRLRDQLNEASQAPVAQAVLPPRAEPAAFTNLPPQVSSFVGREQEQVTVSVLLQTSRLVTLTGIGGVGKTRLALAVASTRVDCYQDGVWLVDLATLPVSATSRTMFVCQTVARVLGLLEKIGEPLLPTLTAFLRPREILLVLDSCEHLIPECAELIQALLARCPRLAVLATSRELLNIAGETAWPVPPLGVPDANLTQPEDVLHCEAAQLFVARAQAKQPEFALTHANGLTVAQICRKLDGIPLSLELAAARLTMFSLEQIAARLDDRLRLLTGGSRTALPRHQTLRAALDWSYALLDEPECVLLRRLAVFAGGCDLDAIEAVCVGSGVGTETVEDAIGSLVHKSLILVRTQDDRVRYRLLDTVRQYSQEHLAAWGEAEAIGERHCRWYVSLAEQARPQLRGAEQSVWLNRLELEHDNIRAALEWSIVHPDTEEYGLRLAGAIWQFWYMRDYQTEGRSWLQRVLAINRTESAAFRAEALNAAGSLAYLQSDFAEAERLLEESLLDARRLEDRIAEARALMNLATIASRQGDYETVLSRYEASLPIFVEHQDMPNAASALYNIGLTWLNVANYDNAHQRLEESLQLFRSLRFNLGIAKALTNLASIMRYRGDIEQAEFAMTEGMSRLLESGDLSYKGEALREMGAIAEARGNYAMALGYFRDALRLDSNSQDEPGCSEAMEELAWVSVAANAEVAHCTLTDQDPAKWQIESCTNLSRQARDAVEHAVKLLAASDKRLASCGQPRYPRQQIQHDARVRWLRSALGEDIFTRSWTAGQRLSHEGALDLAFGTFAHSSS